MPDINITVAHKVAVSDTQSIVCDNSDYMVHWTLDEEWGAYDTKTMRTIYMDGTYTDTVFSGDTIALPVCTVPGAVQIGLFAGNIRTSRVAILRAMPSVRSGAGAPADPTPDVYDQLMEIIKGLGVVDPDDIAKAVADYLAAHPIEETDPTVPSWAKAAQKPSYKASEVGADPSGTAAAQVAAHNTGADTHGDIRLLIQGLSERLSAVADSDDTTLDQLSEIVAYIKSNKSLIDAITTSKVGVADIVDDLTTNVTNKPLSAAQGVALKALIDELTEEIPEDYNLPIASSTVLGGVKPTAKAETMTQAVGVDEAGALWAAAVDLTPYAKKTEVPAKTSQLTNDSGFLTSHQDISGKQDKVTLEADVAAKGFTKNTGTYSKPAGGIPKSDLAAAVQTSLGKADTALQDHQSLAAYRTAAAQDVIDSGKVAKVDGKGLSTNDYTDAAKAKVDAIPAVDTTLTVSGAAADANETGTRLNTLSGKLDNFIASGGFSAPIVDSVDEMVDTSKQYILKSTGTIWAYKETTAVGTVTENCDDGYTYPENSRLGSDGSVVTDAAYKGYVVTPYIDLLKYPVPFTLHLDGGTFLPTTSNSYTKMASYTAAKAKIACYNTASNLVDSLLNVSDLDVSASANNAGSITFRKEPKTNNDNNDGVLKYVRFSGKANLATIRTYVTYIGTTTTQGWVDTGVSYGSSDTTELTEKVAALNNEGTDPTTVTLLPADVLAFYNSAAYPDDDYTVTHLEKITYPYRADIPVPYIVKWNYNESAMRTTVAVDTRAIGTVNAYTLRTYDATGLNKFPIYNLLPNKTYYYKVTHILSNGSLVEAKNGSFTTSSESWRLLYIDGTQNVRDLGGWIGLNGKKVKYGKIIRGAALNDSSLPELLLTGKGRRSLGELAIQAELNLGAIDTETSIAANCVYKKIGYTNYAIAFTDEAYRAQFKEVLEWIVEQLTASKPIYMHCQGGCDRTGTLSFQLLGLLGVSESDLAKEYELSSFSNIGFGRLRTTTKAVDTYDYVGMVGALKAYSGSTVADKFYNFATTGCGISDATISSFRGLMLE